MAIAKIFSRSDWNTEEKITRLHSSPSVFFMLNCRMSEIFVARCRICNEAYIVTEADIDPATEVLASKHPNVPNAEGCVVVYSNGDVAMSKIRRSGFTDDEMVIPQFTRPPGWASKFN